MAKRFTDTEKWNDEWFMGLSPKMKVAWEYLRDTCDHAGFFKRNIALMETRTNAKYTMEEIINAMDGRVIHIEKDKYLIVPFIKFQYGRLNSKNKVHSSVLKLLTENGIGYEENQIKLNTSQGASKPLNSPLKGAKDKDKDKDKEKEKEKEKVVKINAKQNKLAEEVIGYLNSVTGKKLNPNAKGNLKFINARAKEGYKLEDFKTVIDIKFSEWGGDDKMSSYIRPSTLFNEKFDSYLNQKYEISPNMELQNFFGGYLSDKEQQ